MVEPDVDVDVDERIPITVEFSGGLDMLFSNQRKHSVSLPTIDENGKPSTMASLVRHLCKHVLKDPREEFFVVDDAIRPGILVLINDADWGLEGEADYVLQKHDNILFVSTLHGG